MEFELQDFYKIFSCEEQSRRKQTDKIKMAANPALMFGAVCCGIFGISFFCGFYFGTVQSDIEHNKKIDDLIARVYVIFYSAK